MRTDLDLECEPIGIEVRAKNYLRSPRCARRSSVCVRPHRGARDSGPAYMSGCSHAVSCSAPRLSLTHRGLLLAPRPPNFTNVPRLGDFVLGPTCRILCSVYGNSYIVVEPHIE